MLIALISWLFWKLNVLICSTLKYKVADEPKEQVLFALWHGQAFPMFYWARHRRLCLYPTETWRGDIIAYLADKYKFKSIRFREKKSALGRAKNLIRLTQIVSSGYDLAIAADGPPKPLINRKAKPGIFYLSRKTDVPISQANIKMKKKIVLFWRWDKYEIPFPFSEVEINFGKPFIADEENRFLHPGL